MGRRSGVGLRSNVNDDDPLHPVPVLCRVEQGMPAAHGRAGQDEFGQAQAVDECRQVLHEPVPGVTGVCPLALTVATLVYRQHVVVGRHGVGELVPNVGLAGMAVETDQGCLSFSTPVEVPQSKYRSFTPLTVMCFSFALTVVIVFLLKHTAKGLAPLHSPSLLYWG